MLPRIKYIISYVRIRNLYWYPVARTFHCVRGKEIMHLVVTSTKDAWIICPKAGVGKG